MLFVDAEGSEVDVIRGAASFISRCKPAIFIEANPRALAEYGSSAGELKTELVGLGYEIAKVERLRLSPVTETEFPGYQNWICVQHPRQLAKLQRFLRVCAVVPNVPRLAPAEAAARALGGFVVAGELSEPKHRLVLG